MSKMVVELRRKLRTAKHNYHANAETMTVAEARTAADEVAAIRDTISATIAEGAEPCPFCKQKPRGIEHQVKRGYEYEVGCIACPPFKHTDGTERKVAARGGVLPRHTVELWNEGPDYWIVAAPETEFKTAIIGRADDDAPVPSEAPAEESAEEEEATS